MRRWLALPRGAEENYQENVYTEEVSSSRSPESLWLKDQPGNIMRGFILNDVLVMQ